ncbi:MAG: periplasmic heavy metal sensor [Gammaproteobacteria bacterium]|nr:periplasmic heavy metal sensor [Gammaproteobacteria bacterium]
MKTNTFLLNSAGAVALLALSMNAFAHPMSPNAGKHNCQMQPPCMTAPPPCHKFDNLTSEQKSALKKIHAQFRKNVAPLRQSLRANMAMLHAELLQPTTDQTKIDALTKNINQTRNQLFTKRVALLEQIKQATGTLPPAPFHKHRYF